MPTAKHPTQSTRRRRKRVRSRVSAAISLDETLYTQALERAAATADNNFSGYIRELIRGDLAAA
jgi:hypothetical protein